jgi:RNA polymerase sigma-70 factor (ECF subfamily)
MILRAPRATDPASLEAALVERACARDEQAIAALYQRHAAYVARVVHRILGRDADLDDIVQETFVEGLRQLPALKDPAKLRSFLVTIAVRRIHARFTWRRRMRDLAAQLFHLSARVSDPAGDERARALREVLDRQPAKHRTAWVLHRIEEHTLPEVAEQTGASLATVKRWIAKVDSEVEAHDAP